MSDIAALERKIDTTPASAVPASKFGIDHWSLLAYVECRCVDGGHAGFGTLNQHQMQCNPARHPRHSNGLGWELHYSTRLAGFFDNPDYGDPVKAIAAGVQIAGHDEWDRLDDLEAAGFVEILSLANMRVRMTKLGCCVAAKLREHKAFGGVFGNFRFAANEENEHPNILTHSGHYFNFLEPRDNVVLIGDIATALSNICRFTGHCTQFYSVAQHSVLASRIVPEEDALAALLHDAAEAYLGDVSRPLKRLLPDYKAIEAAIEADIFSKLGITLPLPASVKHADLVLLATEQRDLMPDHDDEWPVLNGVAPLPKAVEIIPWMPSRARSEFLDRYDELTGRQK